MEAKNRGGASEKVLDAVAPCNGVYLNTASIWWIRIFTRIAEWETNLTRICTENIRPSSKCVLCFTRWWRPLTKFYEVK